ncbi:hypothetical protein FA15DRAFT_667119 [Coprinopsis marcescibilis]|uniref:Exocyst complex component EXO84 n=1 Tax=Coprinopsis marcescibilis TaxID=230819 RepID=A0A5C3L1U8_COPMA|nr:hypothetical protein FA15DRAFT_667119 [Coprinopsis marcescibilis]
MDSLRSRPSQAPRTVQKSPSKLSKGGATSARAKSTRVDDKIKKRMSMRYAEISSPIDSGGYGGVPAVPSLMGLFAGGAGQASGGDYGDDNVVKAPSAAKVAADDKKLLSADDFDPDAFLKLKLANSTEAELRSLQSALENAKKDTASDLQRSVFKNYAEFVLISKEISVLENEMLELKELLSDYKSMPQMLHIPDPTSLSSATLSTYKRSSVADLKVLYFNQMQTLHSSVEGAAKFVPTTPGRHVVGEFEHVLALNAATYKIIHKVKFVVLDDAVLVAKRRRRNTNAAEGGGTVNEGKLVAEKCWPLNEMLVLDTKDSPSMTNVFKIRHGKETHVYRTDTPQEKKSVLALFRQVAEELSSKRRKEREGEHERRKSMWQQSGGGGGRNSPAPPLPEWMVDLAKKGGDIPNVAADAKEKAERDARWVGDWSDDLTVSIALKEWNKAVGLVETAQARLATTPPLAARLPALTTLLTTSLLQALSLPSNRKASTVNLISLLNRLKAGGAARNAFLEMRGKVIHSFMRKIPFEGSVATYVGELSVVFFTGIKHTADWYLASFKENEVASSFITWAKVQIEKYADIFRKQVYSKDVDIKLVNEAIQITLLQSKKLLEEYGLDFRYLLKMLLVESPQPPPSATVEFRVQPHRQSKQIIQATRQSSRGDLRPRKASVTHLQPAPEPPTLSAAPIGRRRSPAPPPISNGIASLPNISTSSLQPPNSASSSSTNLDISGMASPRPSIISRSRTPVSASRTPTIETALGSAALPAVPSSPSVRRYESPAPPLSASNSNFSAYGRERDRERPPRSLRGSPVPRVGNVSPAPVPVPPRSVHRPGSSVGRPAPRDGMF